MMNDPYSPQTAARPPRLLVMCNNQPLAGVVRASVTSNNYYQCDHFSVSFAMSAGTPGWWDVSSRDGAPGGTSCEGTPYGMTPLVLDIRVSLDGTAWQTLIIGEVDHQHVHIQAGLIEMEGRDLSARLVEAKTQAAYVNQTASQIAATLAGNHGMATNIATTSVLAGRYYEQDHSHVSLGQFGRTTTEWDLLVYLAQREGFDIYMTGNTLNFQPQVPRSADPFVLAWTPPASGAPSRLNGISLNLERSLTLAKDVEVDVRSWNSRQGRGFTKIARAIGGKAAAASGPGKATPTQRYVVVRPNLSEDQAQQLANQMAHEITLHERGASVEMPGELTLTPRTLVKLTGTSTSFDQTYYIASIERSLSFEEGFRQSLRLKNSSPRTQALV